MKNAIRETRFSNSRSVRLIKRKKYVRSIDDDQENTVSIPGSFFLRGNHSLSKNRIVGINERSPTNMAGLRKTLVRQCFYLFSITEYTLRAAGVCSTTR